MLRIIAPVLFENRPEIDIVKQIVSYANIHNIEYSLTSTGINNSLSLSNDEPIGYNHYSTVLSNLMCQVKDGDILFWCDLWNPILFSLFFHILNKNIKIKNYGLLHFNPKVDNEEELYRIQDFKRQVLLYTDRIFVATNYMKTSWCKELDVNTNKVLVTGLPINVGLIKNYPKQNIIVFNHRWGDKGSNSFVSLAKRYNQKGSDLKFVVVNPDPNIKYFVRGTCLQNNVDTCLIDCLCPKKQG